MTDRLTDEDMNELEAFLAIGHRAVNVRLAESLCAALKSERAYVAKLKDRLEWREDGHDGIYCRDETIHALETENATLRADNDDLKTNWSSVVLLKRAEAAESERDQLRAELDAGTEAGWHKLRYERDHLKTQLEAAKRLLPRWKEGDFDLPDYTRGKMDGCHECAKELEQALLTNKAAG